MRSVVCITTNEQFESIKSAALYFGITAATICQTCRKIIPHAGGLRFKYLEEAPAPEPVAEPPKKLKVVLIKKSA